MEYRIESRISKLASVIGLGMILLVIVGCHIAQRKDASTPPNAATSYDTSIHTSQDPLAENDDLNDAPIVVPPKRISHDADRLPKQPQPKESYQSNMLSGSPLAPQFLNPTTLQTEIISMTEGNLSPSKTIVRTANRIHIRPTHPSSTVEWLFVQNPIDPQQINGFKTDHRHKVILEYDDNSLRRNGIASGWAQVANLGVDPTQLGHLRKTMNQRSFASLQFHQYQISVDSEPPTSPHLRELWWNENLALPMQWEVQNHDKIIHLKLVNLNLNPTIDHEQLLDPHNRFPQYMVMDAIDWLEQLHDHSNHSEQMRTMKR